MPAVLHALLESRAETRGLTIDRVVPEHRIPFDKHGGEPRNADVAFVGHGPSSKVAVTIEAKSDEPFGDTVEETMAAALERFLENRRSRGIRRIEDLVRALLRPRAAGEQRVGLLRYQLLTATAGTLAYAIEQAAPVAVLVVHEFITDRTSDELHAQNDRDYSEFLSRLGARPPLASEQPALVGPLDVPGEPLFANRPRLLIGKVVTRIRSARR